MTNLDRRAFVASVLSAAPAAALGGCADAAPPAAGVGMLDPTLLRAVARAVLPAELGPPGIERIALSFESWLSGYQPLAERVHGYGTEAIEQLPPHPGPGWAAQLVALDTAARERFARPFAALEPARAGDLVRSALAAESLDAMPPPVEARHVVVALLAYFYDTPEATDLCYRAAIGRHQCRPLAASQERPAGPGLEGPSA